jgi:hypothetical protein
MAAAYLLYRFHKVPLFQTIFVTKDMFSIGQAPEASALVTSWPYRRRKRPAKRSPVEQMHDTYGEYFF